MSMQAYLHIHKDVHVPFNRPPLTGSNPMCLYHHTFGDFALTIDHDMVVPSIHILLFLATPSFELSPRRSKHGQAQLAIIVDIDISKVQSS